MKIYAVDSKEVKEALNKFEFNTYTETGVRKISGGFATADIFDYDEEYFDIELRWGIQSDCQDTVHTEQYKMRRDNLEIEDA